MIEEDTGLLSFKLDFQEAFRKVRKNLLESFLLFKTRSFDTDFVDVVNDAGE